MSRKIPVANLLTGIFLFKTGNLFFLAYPNKVSFRRCKVA